MTKTAFVVAMVGGEDSPERRRANEVYKYVLKPVFDELGLQGYRADMDFTPGSITERLISQLVSADLVVVDLTGMNPNVFYELGVAHSFGKRVVAIADTVSNLPFDNKDQRTIALGEYPDSGLPAGVAEVAKENVLKAARAALEESYEPVSPVRGAAGIASLDRLAEDDPVASELGQIREDLASLVKLNTHLYSPRSGRDSLARRVAEALVERPFALIEPEEYFDSSLPADDYEWLAKLRRMQMKTSHDSELQYIVDREHQRDRERAVKNYESRRAAEKGRRFVARELEREVSDSEPGDEAPRP